jgi:hypothetical protein
MVIQHIPHLHPSQQTLQRYTSQKQHAQIHRPRHALATDIHKHACTTAQFKVETQDSGLSPVSRTIFEGARKTLVVEKFHQGGS